jgi:carbon-monoxide dehydrogenase medium subunit
MHDFQYLRPTSVPEAKAAIAASADAMWLAGGQTLIPTLKQRLRKPTALVDLAGLRGFNEVQAIGAKIVIGAMATHATVASAAVTKKRIPALAVLAGGIGDAQVRHRGTIGGSIANADPAADYPAAVVALNAEIVTDKRKIPGDRFFKGLFETALEPGELITSVHVNIPDKAAYVKFPNPASRFAVVGVFVAKFKDHVRVAVTGAGPSVFRVPSVEEALATSFTPDAVDDEAVPAEGLNSDLHAAADYRAHLIGVLTKRAVTACSS